MADMTPLADVLNGDPADATDVQNNFQIIEAYINGTDLIRADGTEVMAADLDMDGNKVVNLGSGTASTDAVNKGQMDAAILVGMPVGSMVAYGAAAAPSTWLLCDGTAVNRTTYSALFAVIGTAYGSGNGSTTFNLPDMRDRYPIGDSGTLTLGGTVGSNDAIAVTHDHTGPSHTHTGPSHSHSFSATSSTQSANHTHGSDLGFNILSAAGSGPFGPYTVERGAFYNFYADDLGLSVETANHTHSVSGTTGSEGTGLTGSAGTGNTGSAGSSGTNANRPASVVVNWIIRAGV